MDYLITDETSDPLGKVEEIYTESLLRISNHTVYRPPTDAPAPCPLPCSIKDYITFGSFYNHAKIGDQVIVS